MLEAALTAAGGGARRRPVAVLVLDPAVTPHQPHLTAAGTRGGSGVRGRAHVMPCPLATGEFNTGSTKQKSWPIFDNSISVQIKMLRTDPPT